MAKIKTSRSSIPPGGVDPPDNCSEIRRKVKTALHYLRKGRFVLSFEESEVAVKEQNFCSFDVEIMKDTYLIIKIFRYRKPGHLSKGFTIVDPHARHFKLEIDDSCSVRQIETCLREQILARRKGKNAERNFFIDVKEIIRLKMVSGLTDIVKSSDLKDMNDHFDFTLTFEGKSVEIEYKFSRSGQKSHIAKKSGRPSIHYHRNPRYRNREQDLEILAPMLRKICEDMVNLEHANHL
jgi:hypothetical protein